MENNKNKNIWAVVIGLLVIALVIVLIVRAKNNKEEAAVVEEMNDESALVAPPISTEDTTKGSVRTGTTAAAMTYQQAVDKYRGHTIQFNEFCQAFPSSITFKNNTELMIDNRSAMSRTFHLGFMGDIAVKPWGFKIVKFGSVSLPRAAVIDCDKSLNVASVSLQK